MQAKQFYFVGTKTEEMVTTLKFVALVLSSLLFASASAQPVQDPELRAAIKRINANRDQSAWVVAGAAALGVPFLTASTYHYAKSLVETFHLSAKPVGNYHLNRMIAWGVPAVIIQMGAAMWVLSRGNAMNGHAPKLWSNPGQQDEAKERAQIRQLLSLSKKQQYAAALANPELRRYFIELDAWLRSEATSSTASGQPGLL